MELRQHREMEFHNKAFSEGMREEVDKFYAIVRSSRVFYEKILEAHCPYKNALEYGCGPGSYAFFLARKGATVTGIDISDIAIAQAKESAARNQVEKTDFRLMDAEALKFADHTFDLICGTGILHHLDLGKAFSELARTLKPDGTAIFIEPLGHNPLINLYRKATPHLRTEDEHPLLMQDLKMAGEYFARVETHFFHFNSLLAVPFRKLSGFKHLLKMFDAADRALFKLLPFTRRYAWQVVIVLSDPQQANLASYRRDTRAL